MPRFDVIPMEEARIKAATGRRAQVLKEYLGYLQQLQQGQAGRLQPGIGETVTAVRRRLTAAAKMAGKNLTVKRVGNELFFWEEVAPEAPRRRRGRPRRVP